MKAVTAFFLSSSQLLQHLPYPDGRNHSENHCGPSQVRLSGDGWWLRSRSTGPVYRWSSLTGKSMKDLWKIAGGTESLEGLMISQLKKSEWRGGEPFSEWHLQRLLGQDGTRHIRLACEDSIQGNQSHISHWTVWDCFPMIFLSKLFWGRLGHQVQIITDHQINFVETVYEWIQS